MAFNAQSYRRNQYKRKARAELAHARAIRANPNAYDWELARIPTLVKLARINWRLYLMARRG